MEDTRFEITDELGNKKILNALALIDDPNEDNHYIIYIVIVVVGPVETVDNSYNL